jgi:hypothetical protein
MLTAGEEPLYLLRRLTRAAVEDIGLADPQALVQCIAAKDAYDFLGSPEGELAIVQACLYLATAPKSNAVYTAQKAAWRARKETGSLMPPKHILNAPTKLMKDVGYGKGYAYDHDAPDGFSGQDYWPEEMEPQTFYEPTDRGFEKRLPSGSPGGPAAADRRRADLLRRPDRRADRPPAGRDPAHRRQRRRLLARGRASATTRRPAPIPAAVPPGAARRDPRQPRPRRRHPGVRADHHPGRHRRAAGARDRGDLRPRDQHAQPDPRAAIPRILTAALWLGIAFIAAKFLKSIIEAILPPTGFDDAIRSTGVVPATTTPSRIVANIALVAIMLPPRSRRRKQLGGDTVAIFLAQVTELGGKVIFGTLIIVAGIFLARIIAAIWSAARPARAAMPRRSSATRSSPCSPPSA